MKRLTRTGFTLVEIMIVVAIIALLAAIAIPNVLRGRTSANEAAAIGNLRALVSSLEMFRSVEQEYPQDWDADAYGTCPGGAGLPDPDFGPPGFCIDATSLAGAGDLVQGFTYIYTPAADPAQTYTITAGPLDAGRTGARGFRVTEAGTIFHCTADADGEVPAATVTTTIDQQPDADCT